MDLDGVCMRVTEPRPGQRMLAPVDEHSAEFLAKLSGKKEVIVRVSTPRSPQHHRFVFAYLKAVVDHTDGIWKDVEELLEAVKFAVGHTVRFRRIVNPHAQDTELANEIASETLYVRRQGCGVNINLDEVWYEPIEVTKTAKIIMALRRGADEYVTRPKSINFASLSEDKFKEFHDKAVLALNAFLGFDTTELMKKENES